VRLTLPSVEDHDVTSTTGGGSPALILGSAAGAIVGVGLLGAIVAWIRGSDVSSAMAIAYYFVGGLVFLVGSFPTGGFSLMRGRSRRKPTGGGAMAAQSMLLGALLLGLGVLLDVTNPF
jgi:hypothetical protein